MYFYIAMIVRGASLCSYMDTEKHETKIKRLVIKRRSAAGMQWRMTGFEERIKS